jgi:hypothetical protein
MKKTFGAEKTFFFGLQDNKILVVELLCFFSSRIFGLKKKCLFEEHLTRIQFRVWL